MIAQNKTIYLESNSDNSGHIWQSKEFCLSVNKTDTKPKTQQ